MTKEIVGGSGVSVANGVPRMPRPDRIRILLCNVQNRFVNSRKITTFAMKYNDE